MIKFILGLLITPTLAMAALSDVDRAEMAEKNILPNPGFENGKGSWTASGGSFAIASSGSNLLMGKASATWDSSGAAQTLTTTKAIPNGLKGRPGVAFCNFLTPSGTATHTIQAYDGSNVLSSTTVVSSTSPAMSAATFLFPSSGNISLRIVSVAADEPSITIDSCYLGPSENVLGVLAKPLDVFTADLATTGGVSNENQDFISGNCTNADPMVCTLTSGLFSSTPSCWVPVTDTTSTSYCQAQATSTTNVNISCNNDAGGTTTTTVTKQIYCRKTGADAVLPAFKSDQVANSWSGYHDSTCSWARTNAAYGDPTADASCALVERTNQNFGTVSTSGSVLPAITFTPKKAGKYYVCANPTVTNSSTGNIGLRIWDGTTTIAERDTGVASLASIIGICGIYSAASTSAVTISLQTRASSGTATIAALSGGAASAVEWSVVAIDQSLPAPAIAQDVISSSSGRVKLTSASITTVTTTAVVQQDGSWIGSVTDNGTGDTTINITAGTFSSTPNCVCSTYTTSNPIGCNIDSTTTASSTVVRTQLWTDTGTTADGLFNIVCIGAP